MTYFKYYGLLRYMKLSRKGLLFAAIFFILFAILNQRFLTEENSVTFGPAAFFLFCIFFVYLYNYQVFTDPTNIIYQFPVGSKTRVKYDLITVFFVTVIASIIIYFIIIVFVLMAFIFGNVESSAVNESQLTSLYASLYLISHHFVILACTFPLAYFRSHLKRYIFAGLSFTILFLLNSTLLTIGKASMLNTEINTLAIRGNLLSYIDYLPMVQWIIPFYLVISIFLIFLSYKFALKLNEYSI